MLCGREIRFRGLRARGRRSPRREGLGTGACSPLREAGLSAQGGEKGAKGGGLSAGDEAGRAFSPAGTPESAPGASTEP